MFLLILEIFYTSTRSVKLDTWTLKPSLKLRMLLGSLKLLAIPWLIYVGPKKKMILSPQLHFEKGNESGSAFTALIYRIVKGRIVFKRGGHVFKKGSVETDLQFVLCYTSNLIHRFHESKVSVFIVSIQH